MKTQAELRAEYDRLFEAEDYAAAGKVLDLIEPISDEEWLRVFAEAPQVEEKVPEFIRERIAYTPPMKTQAELRAEYDHLFEAEDYEAAGKVLDLIEPISDEEWLKILEEAPPEDEELSPKEVERLRELTAALSRKADIRAG
ncbi:MAG: hypothetical protein IH609_10110 [Dehalococcoidia bacterium]|nr:hypothetical protein [Dehalococcoidia bacterium]